MSVLIILLIASLSVSILFLCAFIWCTKNKQFEDEYSSSLRILFDDHPIEADEKDKAKAPVIHINTYEPSENTSHQLN